MSADAPPKHRVPSSDLAISQIHYLNFDYLRLFLAIEVVAGHLWAGLMRPGSFWIPIPAVATFVGLSGFLIPQSLERSRNLWHFGWKRVLRTMPALIVLLFAIAMVFGRKPAVGALVQYLTAGYKGQFLGVTLPLWSLIVEDALYASLALLFVFGMHRKVWVTLPILGCLIFSSSHITDAMTDYRLFQTSIAFFTGNLVYIFHDRVRRIPWWIPAAAVAVSLMGSSLMGWLELIGRLACPFLITSITGRLDFPFFVTSVIARLSFPFLIASVIVLAITLPQIRWAIPDLSYGTYIWHGPIMMYLLANVAMARAMPWVITVSLVTLVAALLSWYLVEKRALRLKNVWFASSRPVGSSRPEIASPTAGAQQAA